MVKTRVRGGICDCERSKRLLDYSIVLIDARGFGDWAEACRMVGTLSSLGRRRSNCWVGSVVVVTGRRKMLLVMKTPLIP